MKFCFQFARPAKFYRHLIELLSQLAHLVLPAAGGNSEVEVSAGNAPRSHGQGLDGTCETPDDEGGQPGGDQQDGERIEQGLLRFALQERH